MLIQIIFVQIIYSNPSNIILIIFDVNKPKMQRGLLNDDYLSGYALSVQNITLLSDKSTCLFLLSHRAECYTCCN
jgi:hypothetical protein